MTCREAAHEPTLDPSTPIERGKAHGLVSPPPFRGKAPEMVLDNPVRSPRGTLERRHLAEERPACTQIQWYPDL